MRVQDAISVIETDCEVDFAPPLDYVEPQREQPAAAPTTAAPPSTSAPAAQARPWHPHHGLWHCGLALAPDFSFWHWGPALTPHIVPALDRASRCVSRQEISQPRG